jgi:hypothetical protein
MMSPILPLTLALAAAAADGSGAHHAAFYLVLAAIVPAAAAALSFTGDLAEGKHVLFQVTCSAAGITLLVLSSAVRANAATGAIPPIALAALVGAVVAFAALLLAKLALAVQPVAEQS